MQLALRADSATRINRLKAAGIAMVGASVIAVNPLSLSAASDAAHRIEQRAVELTSGIDFGAVIDDYGQVISETSANLQTLGSEASVALPALFNQVAANTAANGALINTAITGTETAIGQALGTGWYGSDDGYVFGLFGGTLTHDGVTETGSTLQEIVSSLKQGNFFNAFGYWDEWSLEALQHVTKPLLSPILSTSQIGATPTPTLEANYLKNFTNVVETVLNYHNLQNLVDALYSPTLSITYGLLADLGTIGGDISTGNLGGAVTQALEMPADLTGDLLNGYVYPSSVYNPTGKPFTGLLNSGSLFQQLLFTWPNELTTALGGTAPTSAAANALASLNSGLSHLTSQLPNLAKVLQPGALLGNIGATVGPLLAHIAAQLGATLAPQLISGLLLHLPSLILALL